MGGKYVSTYAPELALRIIERLAEGETLNAVCRGKEGMPHPTTFRRWMVQNPELAKAYEVAIRISAVSFEEEALDTARSIAASPKDGAHVRAAEVKLGQLRWSAERRDPTKFGNKTAVNIKVPVQIITPIDLNMAGQQSIPDIYTIDVTTLKSPHDAAQEAKGEPLLPSPSIQRRKQVLIPPSGKRMETPFGKIMRGLDNEAGNVRQGGSEAGDRQEQGGSGLAGDEGGDEQGGLDAQPVLKGGEETGQG